MLRLAFGSALLVLCLTAVGEAQDLTVPNITVMGEAGIATEPDMAEIRAGVTSQGKTAREASDANARVMAAVFAALREAAIDTNDVQTSRYAVQPVFARIQQDNRAEPLRITGYQISNAVTVRVRNIAAVGDVLERVVNAGANTVFSVEFMTADTSRLLDAARASALEDARRKAEVYAKAAGVQVGRLIALAETGASIPRVSVARTGSASPPPLSPGEQMLRVSVTASFEAMR